MDLSTREGIAAFYSAHRESLYRVAATVLAKAGAGRDADDVVMTVVQELLVKRPTGVVNAEAYVIAMVKRRAVDAIRALHPKKYAGAADSFEHVPLPEDPYAPVDEAFDEQLGVAALWDAWDALSDREREVVSQVFLRDHTQKDVARRLGVTPARVSQILAAALRKLRETMEGVER
jgi:RNA polymerase sigma factor (sigma-70 family)